MYYEHLPETKLNLTEFQGAVCAYRRGLTLQQDGWESTYGPLVADEHLEFLCQHGDIALALLPPSPGLTSLQPKHDAKLKAADEAGDLLWFLADISNRNGTTLTSSVREALSNHKISTEQHIGTVEDIESIALEVADVFGVVNKAGGSTTLNLNPFYVFQRCFDRLHKSLGTYQLSGPPTMTDLEQAIPISQAVGECLIVLGYVLPNRLAVSLENTAKFNLAKLAHRQEFTKKYDLSMEQFLGSLGIIENTNGHLQMELF